MVVVHPLVLLSVVDHYNRVAKDTKKRVVGILLGTKFKGKIDVTNSYAVPFEEDAKNPMIWYLDHNYHESMYAMFKKVNAKEKIIGWYSTGPKIKAADLEIQELLRRYTAEPVLCIVDVNPKDDLEIPTSAYISVESKPEDKSKGRRTFQHVPSEIGAYEAEEVGVEHLLRNIRDTSAGTVSDQVNDRLNALKGLKKRLHEIQGYLENVVSGKVPINHQIMYNIQDMFNLRPDLRVAELVKAFAIKGNDNMLAVYLSSMIRSILALHSLIMNKLKNSGILDRESEEKEKKRAEEEAKKKAVEAEAKEKEKQMGKNGKGPKNINK